MLNNEFVAWLVILAEYKFIYSAHALLSACTPGLLLLSFQSVQFLHSVSIAHCAELCISYGCDVCLSLSIHLSVHPSQLAVHCVKTMQAGITKSLTNSPRQ